jgi:gamma-butyrobetaine dioxygenase
MLEPPTPDEIEGRIATVTALLEGSARRDYIGEGVSQLDHALQAAHLAARAGAPDALVLAALLHDVGHLCAPEDSEEMAGLGIADHEQRGADWLAQQGFGPSVTEPVRAHVAAKRYLTGSRPAYADQLSAASRETLRLQGGPMDEGEARAFEQAPGFDDALRLRHFDDAAKRPGWCVPGLDAYRPLLERHLRAPRAG